MLIKDSTHQIMSAIDHCMQEKQERDWINER